MRKLEIALCASLALILLVIAIFQLVRIKALRSMNVQSVYTIAKTPTDIQRYLTYTNNVYLLVVNERCGYCVAAKTIFSLAGMIVRGNSNESSNNTLYNAIVPKHIIDQADINLAIERVPTLIKFDGKQWIIVGVGANTVSQYMAWMGFTLPASMTLTEKKDFVTYYLKKFNMTLDTSLTQYLM